MKIRHLFLLFVALNSTRSHAILELAQYGDVLAFVRSHQIVPTDPILGYQRFSKEESKTHTVYKNAVLRAIPFAANSPMPPTQRLFPVFRIDENHPQTIYIGFAFELANADLGGNTYAYIGPYVAPAPKADVTGRLIRVRGVWREKSDAAVRPLVTYTLNEWGRVPLYRNESPGRGDFLAVSLFKFDLAVTSLKMVNEAVLGLEHALIEEGCNGDLAIYEPNLGSRP